MLHTRSILPHHLPPSNIFLPQTSGFFENPVRGDSIQDAPPLNDDIRGGAIHVCDIKFALLVLIAFGNLGPGKLAMFGTAGIEVDSAPVLLVQLI